MAMSAEHSGSVIWMVSGYAIQGTINISTKQSSLFQNVGNWDKARLQRHLSHLLNIYKAKYAWKCKTAETREHSLLFQV